MRSFKWSEATRRANREMHRDWRSRHPEKSGRFYRYGISPTDYAKMIEECDGFCPICNDPFPKPPEVDHCHKTGAVRGVLCHRCNAMLGMARDSIATLEGAMEYLKRSRE